MEQMIYKYDTHVHTSEASACASLSGAGYIKLYQKLGYDGIIITDHFFSGNTAIPKDLPWNERIELFCSGYESAKREGDRQGFPVFFGLETRFDGDEYLIYGLSKDWLLDHPDMPGWSRCEQFERVDADGGLVVHAHPFRERKYIPEILLAPYHVHAVEVANFGNPPEFDGRAYHYAKHYALPMTAGSDIHSEAMAGKGTMGVSFDEPLLTIHDFVSRVKAGRCGIIAPKGRFPGKPDVNFGLGIRLLGRDGREVAPTPENIFGTQL